MKYFNFYLGIPHLTKLFNSDTFSSIIPAHGHPHRAWHDASLGPWQWS